MVFAVGSILSGAVLPSFADVPPPPDPSQPKPSPKPKPQLSRITLLIADAALPPDMNAYQEMQKSRAAFNKLARDQFQEDVEKQLGKAWKPLPGMQKEVKVTFSVSPSGQPVNISLAQSSGSKAADTAALGLVKSMAVKLDRPPNVEKIHVDAAFAAKTTRRQVAIAMTFVETK